MYNKILVVIKEPGQPPREETIDNELEPLQKIVGGYIEVIPYTPVDGTLLICNEEGKLMGMKPNFGLGQDVIVGTVIICSMKGEDFDSLSELQAMAVKDSMVF